MKIKICNLICLLIILLLSINTMTFANSIIYQKSTKERISSGTELSKYEILTEDGWVIANVLEVDTNDEYTDLTLLTSSEGVSKLSSTMAMTQAQNAIAGINADFFAGNNGKGHSIGISVNNNKIISSFAEENTNKNKLAYSTLFIQDNKEVFMDYFVGDISLYLGKQKEEIKINCYNKYTSYSDTPSIYTRDFGQYSIGSSDSFVATEVVVEDNEVVEIRENKPSCEIPENGFVIMATGSGAWQLKEKLNVGSKVSYKFNYTPDIEKIKFAISGGAILIENGVVPEEFSHNVSGRNPRTCIGIDKSERKFYLITIDGRIKSSIGMTQQEMAEFLQKIGVYSAINLDGGGSTTMVAKQLGHTELSELNTPSGGKERLVANGVGIISSAPSSEKLEGIKIVMEETNIFQGEKRKIKAIGYNQYYNAVEIDSGDIEWSYEGVDVEFTQSGEITGNTVGEATIYAKVGKVKGALEINILSPVNEIFISPKETAIVPGKSVYYTLQAKNKNGYYAGTNDDTYEVEIEKFYINGIEQQIIPETAKIENLTFTSDVSGTYLISFSKGFCKSYTKVDVGVQEFHTLDDFEKKSFTFDPYPDEVGGDAVHSDIQSHSGKYSAKLEYDFDRDAKIRGAYIVLDKPLVVPKEAGTLAFWLYNDEEKDEKLKVKALDGNGHVKLIVIQDNIIHEGWQEIKYNLGGLTLPLTITDVYVAQDDENIRNSSFIYVDDLGYYTSKIQRDSRIKIPKDIKLEDSNNINIRTENSYDIAFIDEIKEENLMIEWLKNKKLIQDINKTAEAVVFTNSASKETYDKYVEEKYESPDNEEVEEQLDLINQKYLEEKTKNIAEDKSDTDESKEINDENKERNVKSKETSVENKETKIEKIKNDTKEEVDIKESDSSNEKMSDQNVEISGSKTEENEKTEKSGEDKESDKISKDDKKEDEKDEISPEEEIDEINKLWFYRAPTIIEIDDKDENLKTAPEDGKGIDLSTGKISVKTYQNKGYDILENEKATIITMDISQNSIRKSDGTQFENLKNDIIDDDTGNIILVLNNSIDNFDDLKERRVFVDMLCDLHRETGKNIMVVHDGYFNDFSMERGIKFLAINSKYNDISEIPEYSYLVISIFENEISYEYKRIF